MKYRHDLSKTSYEKHGKFPQTEDLFVSVLMKQDADFDMAHLIT